MSNTNTKRFFLISCLVIMFGVAHASQASENLLRFAGNIHQFCQLFPQEKVFLQFDNTAYFQGETIWYKAFVVRSSDFRRSESTVLYVDLISPNGVLLQQQKVKIVAGQADGCFSLFDTSVSLANELRGARPYPSGYYEIRAYTQYMLNFDEEILFSRVLPVYQSPSSEGNYANPVMAPLSNIISQNRPETEKLQDVNVQFYPEGGHLIRGLMCNVAFKATDSNGHGLTGKISFTGDDGLYVCEYTGHEGVGTFKYTPGRGRTNAVFTVGDKDYKISIPMAQVSGYSLQVDNITDMNHLVLSMSRSASRTESTIGVTVTCRGELVQFREIKLHDGTNNVSFNTEDWPVGVCRIVIFTERGEVLAARSVFIGNTRYVAPSIETEFDKRNYEPFDKVRLTLNLRDKTGTPFRDRFCLSVRDAVDFGTDYSDNLMTDMLLTSDLKGYIHNPDYYFECDDFEHRRDLDNLCLVQGWERYDWEYMSDNHTFTERKRLEDSLSLNGWIMTNRIGKDRNMSNVKVLIAVSPTENDIVELGQSITGTDGYFGFNMRDFYGKADLTMRVSNPDGSRQDNSAKILLDRVITPKIRAFEKQELKDVWKNDDSKPETEIKESIQEFPTIINEKEGIALPGVDIEGKRKYIDYFTFYAFNTDLEAETQLDFGNYTTDVMGYLIDKGFTLWCPIPDTRWIEDVEQVPGMADPIHTYTYIDDYSYDMSRKVYDISADNHIQLNSVSTPFFMNNVDNQLIGDNCKIDGHSVVWFIHDENNNYLNFDLNEPWTLDIQDIESILVFDKLMSTRQINDYTPIKENRKGKLVSSGFIGSDIIEDKVLVDIKLNKNARPKSRSERKNLGKRITTLTGFTQNSAFYSPQYPEGPVVGDEDYRRTIYWNPNVVTDSEGKAVVEFYNNSYSKDFKISGAGMTATGLPYVLDQDF